MTMKNKKVWYAPNKFEAYGEEEIKAVEECLRDGWLAGFGRRAIEFEEKVAKYFGKKLNDVVEKDDKKSSFKGRKKIKKRQRPKKFSFKKYKKNKFS